MPNSSLPPGFTRADAAARALHLHYRRERTRAPRVAVAALAIAAASVAPAAGQAVEWEDRVFIDANASLQLNGRPFTDRVALTSVSYPVAKAPLTLDVGGGVRVWRSLGIGGGFTKFTIEETAGIRGIDPVPVQHIDSVLHVSCVWVRPLSERMDLAVSGGPSFMSIQQDLVTGTVPEAAVARAKQRTVGLHAAGSFTYFVTRMIGIGASLRHLRGSAVLESPSGSSTTFEATGWQVGFGARLRMR